MGSNNFGELSNRILSNKNLLNDRTTTQDPIDRNLLEESKNFLRFDRESVPYKQPIAETTEQIDIRVKKSNELRERLKKFTKTMKKSFPQADGQCDLHQNVEPIDVPELLNKLNENAAPAPDLDSLLKADEAVFQEHRSNIEKVNKIMETVKGHDCAVTDLSGVGVIQETISLLQETINDANESETMYSALSEQGPSYIYTEEIKTLSNHLYKQ